MINIPVAETEVTLKPENIFGAQAGVTATVVSTPGKYGYLKAKKN